MLAALTFEFYRLRFHLRAVGSLIFPPHKSGNIVRGAFGLLFRKLACQPSCHDTKSCDRRASCPYARVFEPQAARGMGPSGLLDWPRPFVFRAAHLDGRAIAAGSLFHFDVHLFDVREPPASQFALSFAELARKGLGPGRGLAELTHVDHLDPSGGCLASFANNQFSTIHLGSASTIGLQPAVTPASSLRIRFLTPTELKSRDELATRPEFHILFSRLRDRISTLRALYGEGPLPIDFRAMAERAAGVRLIASNLHHTGAERHSTRSGQSHPLGGFLGDAEYEGALTEFLPYLSAGQWTGVGRQTVWGKGAIETTVLS